MNILYTDSQFYKFLWVNHFETSKDSNIIWYFDLSDDSDQMYILYLKKIRYLIGSHTTNYQQPMLFLNTLAVVVLVIAKFPYMHKVRIFGINAGR